MLSFILCDDDTNAYYKHKIIYMMCTIFSIELDKLSRWLAINKSALNIYKEIFMISSNRKSIENYISIKGVNLLIVDCLRFHGVSTEYWIRLKDHITYIS